MSASPPITDVVSEIEHVRFVPNSEMAIGIGQRRAIFYGANKVTRKDKSGSSFRCYLNHVYRLGDWVWPRLGHAVVTNK
jgi:hypothetical protein